MLIRKQSADIALISDEFGCRWMVIWCRKRIRTPDPIITNDGVASALVRVAAHSARDARPTAFPSYSPPGIGFRARPHHLSEQVHPLVAKLDGAV
jgi:hypothetical protein